MVKYNTLYEIVKSRIDNGGITIIEDADNEKYIAHKDLYNRALNVLYDLQKMGIGPDKEIKEIIVDTEDIEPYLVMLWAAILGNIRIVSMRLGTKDEHRTKIFAISKKLDKALIILSKKNKELVENCARKLNFEAAMSQLQSRIVLMEDIGNTSNKGVEYQSKKEDVSLIFFSAGSTGPGKGMAFTNDLLTASIYGSAEALKLTSDDVCLNWTSFGHGIGLVIYYLVSLAAGAKQYSMPTESFIMTPILWMQKASDHKATVLYATNGACIYLVENAKKEKNLNWNLESLRVITNGGDPVMMDVCEAFVEELSKYGLKKSAMVPGYATAESTAGANYSLSEDGAKCVYVNRHSVKIGSTMEYLNSASDENSVSLVNLGPPIKDFYMRICNEKGEVLGENTVGYLHIKGKNVIESYIGNDKREGINLEDGWFNPQDICILKDGELYFITRDNDKIVIGDKIYAPNDIETIAETYEGIAKRTVIAIGAYDKKLQRDGIVLFVQNRRLDPKKFEELGQKLKEHIYKQTGLEVHHVIQETVIPRTTSGKEMRFRYIEKYKKMNEEQAG